MTIPAEWIDAGARAAAKFCDGDVWGHHVQAIIEAALPLIVKDMMEPNDAIDSAMCQAAHDEPCAEIKMPDKAYRGVWKAMLRAWAREYGVDMGEPVDKSA